VQIDSALGDIDVQAGILGIQGNMPSLGNLANALTVFGGARFSSIPVGRTMNKALVLKDGAIVNNPLGEHYGGADVDNGLFNIAGAGVPSPIDQRHGTLSKSPHCSADLDPSNATTGAPYHAGTLFLTNGRFGTAERSPSAQVRCWMSAVVLIRRSPCWGHLLDRQRRLNGS